MNKTLSYIHPENAPDRSVKEVLQQEFCLSVHQMRSVKFSEGGLTVNGSDHLPSGRLVTTGTLLHPGDQLTVTFPQGTIRVATDFTPDDLPPIQILYEDDDLVFLHKPAGMVAHPAGSHAKDTLVNYLASRYEQPARLIGRLDKDTSGVIGAAKSTVALRRMELQRSEGILHRDYLALVHGEMIGSGVCGIPLKKAKSARLTGENGHPLTLMVPADIDEEGSLPAGTEWTALETRLIGDEPVTMLRLHLLTGRTHQIRAHMAALGHPLLGDGLYGPEYLSVPAFASIDRTMLHSYQVTCRQPFNETILTIKTEPPEDFQRLWDQGRQLIKSGC